MKVGNQIVSESSVDSSLPHSLKEETNDILIKEGGDDQEEPQQRAIIPDVKFSDDEYSSDNSSTSEEYIEFIPPYDFSNRTVVKTSDRLLDDLRNDPMFLSDSDGHGILQKPTVEYAHQLANKLQKLPLRYQLYHLDPNSKILCPFKAEDIKSEGVLWTHSGIIAPVTDSTISDFTKLNVFHYRIKIKSRERNLALKHTFHFFKDDELHEEDKKLLILNSSEISESFNVFNDIPTDMLNISNLKITIPEIIDSANYISNETETIIRIEIYPSILTESDLSGFTLTELQTRVVTFNSKASSKNLPDFEGKISPANSFHKLYNSLIGPFKRNDPQERLDIKIPDTKLDVFLDLELLKNKFLFTHCQNEHGIDVLKPQYFYDWRDYGHLIKDYYQRALTECQYFITLFEPFNKPKLPSNIDKIFDWVNDYDKAKQKSNWLKWNNYCYSSDMILLCATSYYDPDVIINLYYTFSLDNKYIVLYFDALIGIEKHMNIPQLREVIGMLRRQGLVGYNELKVAFQKLGLSNIITIDDMYNVDGNTIVEAYRTQLAITESKHDKKSLLEYVRMIATYKNNSTINTYLQTEPFFDVDDAYKLLGVTSDKEDDWILTMYTSDLTDHGKQISMEYSRALFSIALRRRSLSLMNFIQDNLPLFISFYMSIEEAYRILGLYSTAEEETVIRVFQERATTDIHSDYKLLWKALKVVGEDKNSDLIKSFMQTGIIDSNLLSVEKTPAGIENIGNTCYLNSLLQYYFVIKPFRDCILHFDTCFDPSVFNGSEVYQRRRIGGRNAGFNETQRSYQFVHKLKELYYAMIHENARCVIPKRELAFLAFSPIEQVVNIKTDEEPKMDEPIEIISEPEENENSKGTNSKENPITIDSDDDAMPVDDTEENANSKDLSTGNIKEITAKATAMISDEDYQFAIEQSGQQDVTECIQNVLAQTETAMEPIALDDDNEQIDIVKNLFFGKTKQTLTKVDLQTMKEVEHAEKSIKVERFLNLIVSLEDHPKSIYDALDGYFRDDLLEYDNDSVKRSLTITELPSILQIQIQRVQYDREFFRPVKNTDPLPFDQTIYMDRFMETDDERIIAKRDESFQWRVRLKELEKRYEFLTSRGENGMTIKDALISSRNFFDSKNFKQFDLPIDSNTIEVLNDQIRQIDNELMDLRDEIRQLENKLHHQFDEFKKIGYTVFAAFIHRGSATYGHYWIYIRDPKRNVWRVYNDETVSEISTDEVFNFSESNMATPYYLVFVKESEIDSIEPLRREIIKKPAIVSLSQDIPKDDDVNMTQADDLD